MLLYFFVAGIQVVIENQITFLRGKNAETFVEALLFSSAFVWWVYDNQDLSRNFSYFEPFVNDVSRDAAVHAADGAVRRGLSFGPTRVAQHELIEIFGLLELARLLERLQRLRRKCVLRAPLAPEDRERVEQEAESRRQAEEEARIRAEEETKARAEAVAAAVPPLSTILLSNLIKGTLAHVRAKVMNERSAGAVEEYSRTVGRWGSLVGGQPGG